MGVEMVRKLEPDAEDIRAIAAPLREYNDQVAPPLGYVPVALLLAGEDGRTVGGLWGRVVYDWLFVEYLGVPPELRRQGWGRGLMLEAERIAREHGCAGLWVDTFAFQARGFYEKLGYSVFGEIAGHPRGSARYFLLKRLEDTTR